MTVSAHAIQRYAERTARVGEIGLEQRILDVLRTAHKLRTEDELIAMGFNIRLDITKTYLAFVDDKTGERMCAVLDRQGNVITLLTREMFPWHGKRRKMRNDVYSTARQKHYRGEV